MKISLQKTKIALILILSLCTVNFGITQSRTVYNEKLLELLDVKPGMCVADIGAGKGRFSFVLAELVGPEGHVYANEIRKSAVDGIEKKRKEQGVDNLTAILGEEEDPILPDKVDLLVLQFVYHHLASPEPFMRSLLKYMKPGARLAVIATDAHYVEPEKMEDPEKDVCVSDPEITGTDIEKAGFKLEKFENIMGFDLMNYVLIFKAAEEVREAIRQYRGPAVFFVYKP